VLPCVEAVIVHGNRQAENAAQGFRKGVAGIGDALRLIERQAVVDDGDSIAAGRYLGACGRPTTRGRNGVKLDEIRDFGSDEAAGHGIR
jgi:hypothetical protein